MGVCLYKKCIIGNEKKQDIVNNVSEKDKLYINNQIESELPDKEKIDIAGENELNKNEILNNDNNNNNNNKIDKNVDIATYIIKSTYKYNYIYNYPYNGHLSNNKNNNNNYQSYMHYKENFEKLIYFTKPTNNKMITSNISNTKSKE